MIAFAEPCNKPRIQYRTSGLHQGSVQYWPLKGITYGLVFTGKAATVRKAEEEERRRESKKCTTGAENVQD